MRVRNRPGAAEMLAAHPNFVISDPTLWKGKTGLSPFQSQCGLDDRFQTIHSIFPSTMLDH